MNGTQTFNVNAAECLRDVVHLGTTQVHNVCSGTITVLPWGLNEWIVAVLLSLILVTVFWFLALLVWVTVR